jgi:hypothetical protein
MSTLTKRVCAVLTVTGLTMLTVSNLAVSAHSLESLTETFSTSDHIANQGYLLAQSLRIGGWLTELESNIKWSAVQGKWRERRDYWLSDVKETTDPASLAELLVELERNIKWSAVDGAWRGRRDGWVRSCQAVQTSGQLSQLLLELESNIKWSAVDGAWRSRRDSWVNDVRRSG